MDAEIVRELIEEENPEALFADGFDEAIIGYSQGCGRPSLVVYDIDKCISVLAQQGMSDTEAEEYFWFNVAGGWLGEHTPLFVHTGERFG